MPTAPVVRIQDPGDLLAALPYLTGYHLESSLVCVCVRDDLVGMVARVDLPRTAEEGREAIESIRPAVTRQSPSGVAVVGYGNADHDPTEAVQVLATGLARTGTKILSEVAVVDGSWWVLSDSGRNERQPVPTADHPVALECRVASGAIPAPGRTVLAERIAAGSRAAHVGRTCAQLNTLTLIEASQAWAEVLTADRPVEDLPNLTLASAARSVERGDGLRDALLSRFCGGLIPLEQFPASITAAVALVGLPDDPDPRIVADRLEGLCRCLPDPYAVAPATMLAGVHWRAGNGAQARVALGRALGADPDYSLAQLIGQLLDLAVPPPRFARQGRSML